MATSAKRTNENRLMIIRFYLKNSENFHILTGEQINLNLIDYENKFFEGSNLIHYVGLICRSKKNNNNIDMEILAKVYYANILEG